MSVAQLAPTCAHSSTPFGELLQVLHRGDDHKVGVVGLWSDITTLLSPWLLLASAGSVRVAMVVFVNNLLLFVELSYASHAPLKTLFRPLTSKLTSACFECISATCCRKRFGLKVHSKLMRIIVCGYTEKCCHRLCATGQYLAQTGDLNHKTIPSGRTSIRFFVATSG